MASSLSPNLTELAMDVFDELQFADLLHNRQHDQAIAYVDRFREDSPDDPELRRCAALARGGKGEHALESIDGMGIEPSKDRLEALIALFEEAIEVDPTLADPYWDLAVIHGRFTHDHPLARNFLAKARDLGYEHSMMARLEGMLAENP